MSRPYKHALIALAAVLALVGVPMAVHAATTNAACTANPVVTDTGTGQRITVVCTVPKPAPVTVTATVTQTAAPSPTPTPTPTVTPTPSQTPTPTPTATPTVPPPPPTGWPDGSNTGVPAGTVLTSWTGGCTISSPVTIDARTINCPNGLDIEAANVTITRSKISGPVHVDSDAHPDWSVKLTDVEVAAGATTDSAISNGNITLLRVNVSGGGNGLQCEEHSSICSITDSWVHGQYIAPGSVAHLGGVSVFGSTNTCTGPNANGVPACFVVQHNTVLCEPLPTSNDGGCTGDINILLDFGPLHGALITDNLLKANIGAAYCSYGGEGKPFKPDHIVYRRNVFERGTNGKCANYGPITGFDGSRTGSEWTGNVWSSGEPVPPEN